MGPEPSFDDAFKQNLRELFRWRRDVRRFKADAIDAAALTALMEAASMAPSVGLSEPWRFAVVKDEQRRKAIRNNFSHANADALKGYSGDKAKLYASLKLEGLSEAPEHVAVFCDLTTPQGSGLGRATMPEMLEYSVVAAIQNFWLAARAQGIGVGWISILDPQEACKTLEVPSQWKLVAYLCVGIPETCKDEPELMSLGWETRGKVSQWILPR